MSKLRVLYIVHEYPAISETYIRSEIEALSSECEIRVISLNEAEVPYHEHAPYQCTKDAAVIWQVIQEFRPDVIHSHWLYQTRILAYFGGYFAATGLKASIPFTIRAHSFDVLLSGGQFIQDSVALINSDLCLGILAFPFARPLLEKAGVSSEKIHDCYPVVNYARFYDTSPNGEAVMNVGACLPKKQMEDFLKLGAALPDKQFNLYALGHQSPEVSRLNEKMGHPINLISPVQPQDMLPEYKKHRWLVYTASREMNTVGWPMAVAEAQAAGVGVCMPNIRADLHEYVGDAGFLYDSISEVAEIISKPFPEEMRHRGFMLAKKSDIFEHKTILTNLWRKVVGNRSGRNFVRPANDGVAAWGERDSPMELSQRLYDSAQEINQVVPSEVTILLVGDPDQWEGDKVVSGRHIIPFLEQNGNYNGAPIDDNIAIEECERLRHGEPTFMVFGWPSFWWLEHYSGFNQYLQSRFRRVLANDRLVVFDLRVSASEKRRDLVADDPSTE